MQEKVITLLASILLTTLTGCVLNNEEERDAKYEQVYIKAKTFCEKVYPEERQNLSREFCIDDYVRGK